MSDKPKHKNNYHIFLKMVIWDLETDTIIREHEVNYSNANAKAWMEKTLVWALKNKKSVELISLRDDAIFNA